MSSATGDNALTLIALRIRAFILAVVAHEALGHGLTAVLLGAKPILLTICYLSTRGNVSRAGVLCQSANLARSRT